MADANKKVVPIIEKQRKKEIADSIGEGRGSFLRENVNVMQEGGRKLGRLSSDHEITRGSYIIGNEEQCAHVYPSGKLQGQNDKDKVWENPHTDTGREETELAFRLADRYISIQEASEGYDYTIYDMDYRELDGGVLDNPDITIRQALDEIVSDLKEPAHRSVLEGSIQVDDELIPIGYDGLMEKAEQVEMARLEECIKNVVPEAVESKAIADFKEKTEELFNDISGQAQDDIELTIYAISKAVMLENGRGFAQGEYPTALSPFVTWGCNDDEDVGQKYEWEPKPYGSDQASTEQDALKRVENHQEQLSVKVAQMESPGPYKYYSTQRPVDIGTFPKPAGNAPDGIVNYDKRVLVEGGSFLAWGHLTYTKPLTEKQAADYELRPAMEISGLLREDGRQP